MSTPSSDGKAHSCVDRQAVNVMWTPPFQALMTGPLPQSLLPTPALPPTYTPGLTNEDQNRREIARLQMQ